MRPSARASCSPWTPRRPRPPAFAEEAPQPPLTHQTLAQQCALVAQQLSPAITTAQLLARVVGGGAAHVLTQLSEDELLDLLSNEAGGGAAARQ